MHNNSRRSLFSLRQDVNCGRSNPCSLYHAAKGNLDLVQRLQLQCKLDVHRGCVNTICWNSTGELILSGSDDQFLNIVNPYSQKSVFSMHSGHRANIFSAKFLPSTADNSIVSCSGDGLIYMTDVSREQSTDCFNCHFGTVYEIVTVPGDPNSFLSCGEDGTVRWFDLRLKKSCRQDECKEDVLINCRRAVTSLAVDPVHPYYLTVGCSDSSARIFDRRMLGTRLTGSFFGRGITGLVSRFVPPSLKNSSHRITSLQYSNDGQQILVSYSSDYIYIFDKNGDAREEKSQPSEPEPSCSSEPAQEASASTSECTEEPTENETASTSRQPPIKRLRLRGDWSDTGPHARPEMERASNEAAPQSPGASMMQRMSDMLTRWLNPDAPPNETADNNENETSQNEEVPGNSGIAAGESDSNDVNRDSVCECNVEPSSLTLESPEMSCDTSKSGQRKQSGFSDSDDDIESAETGGTLRQESGACAIEESTQSIDREILLDTFGETSQSPEATSVIQITDLPSTSSIEKVESVDSSSSNRSDEQSTECTSKVKDILPESNSCDDTLEPSNHSENTPKVKQSDTESTHLSDSGSKPPESSASTSRDAGKSHQYVSGISLHYSSEGTTAGTVKLNFTTSTPGPQSCPESSEGTSTDQAGRSSRGQSEGSDNSHIGAEGGTNREEIVEGATVQSAGSVLTEAIVSSVASDETMRAPPRMPPSSLLNLASRENRPSPPATLRPVPGLSRERAAIRLQELYRKRQELRDTEDISTAKDVRQPPVKMCFKGHRNSRTMIKEANFWGDDYVMSGSDCGHIFIWDRYTGRLTNFLEADKHVVNCVQPHPFDPVLASSGIDYNIKLWMPDAAESTFDEETARKVMRRNQTMLEETRDTITVPASFMLRMLASLNHLRSGRRAGEEPDADGSDSEQE